ncbi:MAG: metallophosphatase family protein [Proteobacteria bacterium]|nr:metallophosphatase family protein [Pseudomonadota bacterium]MBU1058155.1 metallophosphatase family protein [Pseudomonadota bacterium]
MAVKIGLISDVHATVAPLREALTLFAQEHVDLVLCTGDLAGYGTELEQSIELLVEKGCITILGNHDIWYLDNQVEGQEGGVETFFHTLPVTWEAMIEGKRIFAVHASPPLSLTRGITLLNQDEKIVSKEKEQWAHELEEYDLDVLIVGHTHQVFAEVLGQTLVINPGSTKFNHSCAILSLPGLEVRIVSLSGKMARKVWHWGMMTRAGLDN